ncbi:VIT1/CCC1 transporter family protein [Nocardioides sp. AE5]|uniref:VIT1/CCC1 transporter family protein n=1 Tax=Nocardioides sp. AE5 TaxID=2962573 RepID=UPI0028823F04|nr:VIT1/CCC1 transporter family protein [Nocardioides sp. AE5]MDT0201294.1 VIT1/CCC1 transporter family protein [Nocardioides sp. AE5]
MAQPSVHVDDHDHGDVTGGWLRPAVFGAMDALVSNAALIAGVAGGTQGSGDTTAIVLAGLAGLAAGACSMAAGEYASVASQAEAAEFEVDKERRAITANPRGEQAELAAMLEQKGLEEELAAEVAEQVHRDLDSAVAVHAMEEFGVDPDELASPTVAAGSSFLAFSLGALVPLLPYLLGVGSLWPAMVVTLVALFICGAVVTRVTIRPWWFGGGRQVLLGAVAFAVTYLVGLAAGGTIA